MEHMWFNGNYKNILLAGNQQNICDNESAIIARKPNIIDSHDSIMDVELIKMIQAQAILASPSAVAEKSLAVNNEYQTFIHISHVAI